MQKTILITGTSNGFGKDAALTLAAAGHRVFATMRDIDGRNRAAADELRARSIDVVEMDVKLDASVAAAFAQVLAKTGGTLDVLVNNAGLMIQGISETITALPSPSAFRYEGMSAEGQSLQCTISARHPGMTRPMASSTAAWQRAAKRVALSGHSTPCWST